MESPDLNSPAPDARLESLLRTAPVALADDGFSTRVLNALPSPAKTNRRLEWARPLAYLLGTLAGGSYALAQGLNWEDFSASANSLATSVSAATLLLSDPVVITALAVAALSLAVAFQSELRERLTS